MDTDSYTYRVSWSPEDGEYFGLCTEFPSLSCLVGSLEKALAGIQHTVVVAVREMQGNGEEIPLPKRIDVAKGVFTIPEEVDRQNEEIARLFLSRAELDNERQAPC